MPWMARAPMNSIIVRAMAQSPLPTVNATMPIRYVRRRPHRSEPGPQIGIDTAAASMNDREQHTEQNQHAALSRGIHFIFHTTVTKDTKERPADTRVSILLYDA